LQAVVLLEQVQKSRTKSSGLRLTSAALYTILGAPLEASKQLAELDIKHIQHDTLSGHWHLPALVGGACFSEASNVLTRVAGLFQHHLQDCGSSLMKVYDHANYTKVVEFVEFKERLDDAIGRASSHVESAFLRIRSAFHEGWPQAQACMHDVSRDQQFLWSSTQFEKLRFNEDLSTRPSWLPPSTAGPSLDLADWWENHAQTPLTGLGDCWWSEVSAAESSAPQAVQYRRGCLETLQRRTLHLQLLSALPTVPPEPHAPHLEAFRKLLELEGVSEEGLDAWTEGVPPSVPDLRLTQLSHRLTLLLLAAAQASRGGNVASFQLRLKQLQSSFLATGARLSSEVLASRLQCSLPRFGPALVAASTFLQQLLWTSIWLHSLKAALSSHSREKKGKGHSGKPLSDCVAVNGGPDAQPEVAVRDSAPHLLELQRAVIEAAKGLKETLSGKLDCGQIARDLCEAIRDADVLWEGDKKAALVTLTQVVKDHQAHMARLGMEARVVMERLIGTNR